MCHKATENAQKSPSAFTWGSAMRDNCVGDMPIYDQSIMPFRPT